MCTIRVHFPFIINNEYQCVNRGCVLSFISRRPLSDAEKRLHEAAKNGNCDEIRALAAGGTDMSCTNPNYVRK